MAHLKCKVVVNHIGTKSFVPVAKVDGKKETPITSGVTAFNLFPDGSFVDMRNKEFLQLIPCPYCGSELESKHDPQKHIHKPKIKSF